MSEIDRKRIEAAVSELLAAIGEDPAREGLVETPARFADAYAEFFDGLHIDPIEPLKDSVSIGENDAETVLVRDIQFRSMCEHHLLPFHGTAHIAYSPGDRVIGLGRLARVVEILAARPQLQERLSEEIADALVSGLHPRGVLVVMDATHGCVTARGPRQTLSSTVTIASRGVLAQPGERSDLLALIGGNHE